MSGLSFMAVNVINDMNDTPGIHYWHMGMDYYGCLNKRYGSKWKNETKQATHSIKQKSLGNNTYNPVP